MKHNSFSNVILLCQDNLSTESTVGKIHRSQKTTQKACPTVMPQSRRAPQRMKKKQLETYLDFTHLVFWELEHVLWFIISSKAHFTIKTDYYRSVFLQLYCPQMKIHVATR